MGAGCILAIALAVAACALSSRLRTLVAVGHLACCLPEDAPVVKEAFRAAAATSMCHFNHLIAVVGEISP